MALWTNCLKALDDVSAIVAELSPAAGNAFAAVSVAFAVVELVDESILPALLKPYIKAASIPPDTTAFNIDSL